VPNLDRAALFALLLAMIALGLATIAMIEAKETNNGLPLVHADFPSCTTVRPSPLLRTPRGRHDYQQGAPSNDKGIS
jgi:hypothetical protein